MVEFKEGEDCNRRNTFEYFEDYNLSLTQKSGKLAICGWALVIKYRELNGIDLFEAVHEGVIRCKNCGCFGGSVPPGHKGGDHRLVYPSYDQQFTSAFLDV